MIFNIQQFATQDGKGIRTVVFFKGCPLHCLWCSNPESQSFEPELMYEKVKCIGCEECVNATDGQEITREGNRITLNVSKVKVINLYKELCPAKALNVVGESKTVSEIVDSILKDVQFYKNSDGGVTFSGGEPFAQPELLLAVLKELKKHDIDVNIESCLHVKWENIEKCLPYIDCILADLKHVNAEKYKKFTGGDIELPLGNFKKLAEANANAVLRIPVIPTFNDTEEEMNEILNFAVSLERFSKVDFMPYHTLGKGKYTSLMKKYNFSKFEYKISKKLMGTFAELAKSKNIEPEILG